MNTVPRAMICDRRILCHLRQTSSDDTSGICCSTAQTAYNIIALIELIISLIFIVFVEDRIWHCSW